jgi:hypothetical protein
VSIRQPFAVRDVPVGVVPAEGVVGAEPGTLVTTTGELDAHPSSATMPNEPAAGTMRAATLLANDAIKETTR